MRHSCGHGHDPHAVACPVCMVEVRDERDALLGVVKGAHGALYDAGNIVVPGSMLAQIAPAIEALTAERDAAVALLGEARVYVAVMRDAAVEERDENGTDIGRADDVASNLLNRIDAALAAKRGG